MSKRFLEQQRSFIVDAIMLIVFGPNWEMDVSSMFDLQAQNTTLILHCACVIFKPALVAQIIYALEKTSLRIEKDYLALK